MTGFGSDLWKMAEHASEQKNKLYKLESVRPNEQKRGGGAIASYKSV